MVGQVQNPWTPEQIVVMRHEWGQGEAKDLADKLGHPWASVKEKAKKLGMPSWTRCNGKSKRVEQRKATAQATKYDISGRKNNPNWISFIKLIVFADRSTKKDVCWSNVIETAMSIVRTGKVDGGIDSHH